MPRAEGHQRGLLAGPTLAPFLGSHHVLPPSGVPAHDGPLATPAISTGLPGQFGGLLHAGMAALHGDVSAIGRSKFLLPVLLQRPGDWQYCSLGMALST